MAKRVVLDCYLQIGAVDRRAEFNSFAPELTRAQVDAGVFGNGAEKYELGLFSGTITGDLRSESTHTFLTYLIQRLGDGADVAVIWRPKNSAKATDNPELTFNVKIDKVPMGGARGELANSGQLSMKINGTVLYDDGAVTVTLGASA
jgi:hypothetical protein